jgi:PAS domain S-box-containing protein
MTGSRELPPAPSPPSRAEARRGGLATLPARTLLVGIFIGRLVTAVLAVVIAGLAWTSRPEAGFLLVVAVLIALLLTAYGVWRTVVQGRATTVGVLLTQALADLGLVSLLGYHVGPDHPLIIALFVVILAVYALVLPLRPGIVMVGAAVFSYYLSVITSDLEGTDLAFWGQMAVFVGVFSVVAYLGTLLRAAEAEQSALETELAQARLEADDILQHISAGILTVDGQGRLGFINPTAAELLGVNGAAIVGGSALGVLANRSPELHAAILAGIEHGRRINRGEGWVTRPDGRRFPIGLSTTTFARPGQHRPAVTAIFSDISDLRRIQELHQRAERLEAVAELGASLAHEIRNPLASIRSSVEQLAGAASADPDDRLLGKLIIRESDRLTRLLSEFLDFSRVRVAGFAPVDLHALARDAARLVREHPECTARVRLEVEGDPTWIEGDADLLQRVLINLLLNAVQAVAGHDSGAGTVRVRVDQPDPEGLPLGREFDDPVRLRVSDNGPGVDPELVPRLFEPFVSGRPGGSGLGLAIVQRAVEAHRGLVFVDSAPHAGTTFTIYLHARAAGREPA